MIPKTGSTVRLRFAYKALPASVRSLSRIATSRSSVGAFTARELAF